MKTRFPTTSGKSPEIAGNRPPSRTLPRRLPPTPKGVGGKSSETSAFGAQDNAGNRLNFAHFADRAGNRLMRRMASRTGRPCSNPAPQPPGAPEGGGMGTTLAAWCIRPDRGRRRPGRRGWTRHRGSAPEGGDMGTTLAAWCIRPDRGRR